MRCLNIFPLFSAFSPHFLSPLPHFPPFLLIFNFIFNSQRVANLPSARRARAAHAQRSLNSLPRPTGSPPSRTAHAPPPPCPEPAAHAQFPAVTPPFCPCSAGRMRRSLPPPRPYPCACAERSRRAAPPCAGPGAGGRGQREEGRGLICINLHIGGIWGKFKGLMGKGRSWGGGGKGFCAKWGEIGEIWG